MQLDRWGFPLRGAVVKARPPARRPVKGPGSAGHARLLAALRTLCASRKRGQTFSTRAIARASGFSPKYIQNTERSALRKMRNRLPAEVRAEFDALISKFRSRASSRETQAPSY